MKTMKLIAVALAGAMSLAMAAGVADAPVALDLPAQAMEKSLAELSQKTGLGVIFADQAVGKELQARALKGSFSAEEALKRLLADTGLSYRFVNERTVAIRGRETVGVVARTDEVRVAEGERASPKESEERGKESLQEVKLDIPEILIKGSKSLNSDIRRTREDVQPYIVFNAEEIQQSGAANLDEFLKTHLPMNTVRDSNAQNAGSITSGNLSSIDLRGLGSNQTLILIDGRRLPSVNLSASQQPDINGIPLALIERVEILPSTASGIYGGGATGGVINIITKRTYSGGEVAVTYDNTFRTDLENHRLDATAGFSLNEARTRFRLSASESRSGVLLVEDRDFASRARALQLVNDPNGFFSLFFPALGRQTNIHSLFGTNLVLNNGTPLNSPITFVPAGYTGSATDGGVALVGNAGKYNTELPNGPQGLGQSLITAPTVDSLAFDARQEIGGAIEVFGDFSWNRNRSRSEVSGVSSTFVILQPGVANNPFNSPIIAVYPVPGLVSEAHQESETARTAAGAIVRLYKDWRAVFDYAWSRSRWISSDTNPAVGDPDGTGPGISSSTALANGTLNVIRDVNAFPLNFSPYLLPSPNRFMGPNDTILVDTSLRLSGPMLQAPGGAVTLSGMVERRKEEAKASYLDSINAAAVMSTTYTPPRSAKTDSYYLETVVPLVSGANSRPLLQEFSFQASLRRDEYVTRAPSPTSVSGLASRSAPVSAFNYFENSFEATKFTAGFRYAPVNGIALRASYGTGFLPPNIRQIAPDVPQNFTIFLADPKRGGVSGVVGPVTLTIGGNPGLNPEQSKSLSVGVVLSPRFVPNFRLSVDYTEIKKVDEIYSPNETEIVTLEADFPGRVTRAVLTPAEIALGYTGGAITAIDETYVNISKTKLHATDIQLDYSHSLGDIGKLSLYSVATFEGRFERQITPLSQLLDSAGYAGGPLKWRGNAGITWEHKGWLAGWNMQYYDSYWVYPAGSSSGAIASLSRSQGSGRIPVQTYHDLFVRYRFPAYSHALGAIFGHSEVNIGIQNVLDKNPPIIATTATGGGYSGYGDPRLRRFEFTLRKSF